MPREREGRGEKPELNRREYSPYESQENGTKTKRPRPNKKRAEGSPWVEKESIGRRPRGTNDRRSNEHGINYPNGHKRSRVRRKEEGRQNWSTGKKVGIVVLSILLALLMGAIGVFAHFLGRLRDDVITERFTPEQVSIAVDHDFMFDEDNFLMVAIFGDDTRGYDYGRTDTIIIASLNLETSEIRMASLFRDTLLELDGGFLDKASHAYAFGGSQGAISMLNRNLDLNIQHYVTVDFTATALVVDALGGVEIDVSWGEIEYINGLSFQMVTEGEFDWGAGFTIPPEINHPGVHNLCGVQALAYMRIRTVGNNDFRRTERQREVIELVMRDAQRASLGTINEIVNHVFDHLSTNFSLAEILAYGRDINNYHLGEATGFPFDLTTMLLPRSGDTVIPTTLESNVIQLHYFLFGTENYVPSSTVMRISNEISSLTGTTIDSAIDIDGEWEFIPPDVDIPWDNGLEIPSDVDSDLPEEPETPEVPEIPEIPDEPEYPVDPEIPDEPPTEGRGRLIMWDQWVLLVQLR